MRREERVTVQGPIKEQQPDGMSHRGLAQGLGICAGGGGQLLHSVALYRHTTPSTDPVTPYPRRAGLAPHMTDFDAAAFNMKHAEALYTDPQHRVALEVAWLACEHGFLLPQDLKESNTGVYIGVSNSDYLMRQLWWDELTPVTINSHFAMGNAFSCLSGRIAYHLNLKGPALSIDTACSSSLVAVHAACRALQARDCTLCLAGGVNAILHPATTIALCQMTALSPRDRCATFDASADGYCRGEGCGIVVLKLLPDALADGDQVCAVISGSAVNQDGSTNGLTAPNGFAQQGVIEAALADAKLEPQDVDVVEVHGVGTPLGDPIEIQALGAVYGPHVRPAPLVLSSVKANIGHLESAAGVAGLIKLVLSLDHGRIPALLHFTSLNPHLPPLCTYNLEVASAARDWPETVAPDDAPRRGGVSSFGFSGTNAHLLVAEGLSPATSASPAPAAAPGTGLLLTPPLCLSARTAAGLRDRATAFAAAVAAAPASVPAACAAAVLHRPHFAHRLACARPEAAGALRPILQTDPGAGIWVSEAPKHSRTAILFMGEHAQYFGMGARLAATHTGFQAHLQRAAALFDPHLSGVSLLDLIGMARPPAATDAAAPQPPLSQFCGAFAVEYALARLLIDWGVRPDVLLGVGVGEYVCACVGGLMSEADAALLVVAHATLVQEHRPEGSTLAVLVMVPREAAEAAIEESCDTHECWVSMVLTDACVVLSGYERAVEDVLLTLDDCAFTHLGPCPLLHTPAWAPHAPALRKAAARVPFRPRPTIPVISALQGKKVCDGAMSTPDYWAQAMARPVDLRPALPLLGAGPLAVIELLPHPVLSPVLRSELPGHTVLAPLQPGVDDLDQVRQMLARLYVSGVRLNWAQALGCAACHQHIPPSAFTRSSLLLDLPALSGTPSAHPLLVYRPKWVQCFDQPPRYAASSKWLVMSNSHRPAAEGADGEVLVRARSAAFPGGMDPLDPQAYRDILATTQQHIVGIQYVWCADCLCLRCVARPRAGGVGVGVQGCVGGVRASRGLADVRDTRAQDIAMISGVRRRRFTGGAGLSLPGVGGDGRDSARRNRAPGPHRNTARQATDGLWTEVCGQQKQSNDPGNNQHILNMPTTGHR